MATTQQNNESPNLFVVQQMFQETRIKQTRKTTEQTKNICLEGCSKVNRDQGLFCTKVGDQVFLHTQRFRETQSPLLNKGLSFSFLKGGHPSFAIHGIDMNEKLNTWQDVQPLSKKLWPKKS